MSSEEYKKRITVIDDEEFLERLEVKELLKRYAAGERDFRCFNLSGADLSKLDFGERSRSRGITYNKRIILSHANLSGANLSNTNLQNAIMPDGTIETDPD